MVLTYTTFRLECIHPFKISRSSYDHYNRIFIYLEQDGIIGRGEAAPSERYNESIPQIIDILKYPINLPKNIQDIDEIIGLFNNYTNGFKSFRAACINALIDWWSQKLNLSVSAYYNFNNKIDKPTSFTIPISALDELEYKIAEAEQYQILKVKLGTSNDREIIRRIRTYTDKPIRVDVNEGWDLKTAKEMCLWLAEYKIELIEQPLPEINIDQMSELKALSPIPIIADENCKTKDDIVKLAGKFDGINIKLAKCGGLDEAVKMIEIAKSNNLKIMLGCMVESSIGITAISQLGSQADFIDVDGNLLVNNDPYSGLTIKNGIPHLPKGIGMGVNLKAINEKQKLR